MGRSGAEGLLEGPGERSWSSKSVSCKHNPTGRGYLVIVDAVICLPGEYSVSPVSLVVYRGSHRPLEAQEYGRNGLYPSVLVVSKVILHLVEDAHTLLRFRSKN